MVDFPRHFRTSVAAFTALVFTFSYSALSFAGPEQAAGMGAAAATAGLGSALSSAASAASIASGNGNIASGQATQNQGQVAMGAMQVAMGLLGALAALAAAAQAGKGNKNKGNMNDITGGKLPKGSDYNGTSPTGSNNGTDVAQGPDSTSLGDPSITSAMNQVDISSDGLRTGTLGAAMDGIEKIYGIPRDKFMDALRAGVDPKALLANAPKNAMSMDILNRISDGLAANNSMSAEQARLLASSAANALNGAGGLPSQSGVMSDSKSVDAYAAKGPSLPASLAPPDGMEGESATPVSPEIRAALAAKAEQARLDNEMRDMHGWSIFQLVHNRYQKLEAMLYGRVERTNPNPSSSVTR
ncbi:MAG TPA: hypothetical protein VIH99_04300 [Bdellovibrionota bacterium]|jgi:hypothetical protein